jgi:hypothetical protein
MQKSEVRNQNLQKIKASNFNCIFDLTLGIEIAFSA